MAKNCIIFCVTLIVLCGVFCPATARYSTPDGSNAGINHGDWVFIGEKNVDFSALENPSRGELFQLVCIEDSQPRYPISLSGMVASTIPSTAKRGAQYYPYYQNGSSYTYDTGKFVYVDSPLVGDMKLYVYDTDVNPVRNTPDVIPLTMDVQFYVDDINILNLRNGNFSGPWYDFVLKLPSGSTQASVTNKFGNTVSLEGCMSDPSVENEDMAFSFLTQGAGEATTPGTMEFRINVNGLQQTLSTYVYYLKSYPIELALDKTNVGKGESIRVTVSGEPYQYYTLQLSGSAPDDPTFDPNGDYDIPVSGQEVVIHPGWDGKKEVTIFTRSTTPSQSYSVTAYQNQNPSLTRTMQFTMFSGIGGVSGVKFEDVDSFNYAVGDIIKFEGSIEMGKSDDKWHYVYLYMTGPNLPPNGASLENPLDEVVDGDKSTFTVAPIFPGMTDWEYLWNTHNLGNKGCGEGTYTIYASANPVGYTMSAPDSSGSTTTGDSWPYHDVYLGDPTLQAKFDELTGARFAQGDRLYSWWYARGSPGITGPGDITGKLRWYIFGDNFRYTDFNDQFPVYEGSFEYNGHPTGYYGFVYPRDFTCHLNEGTYHILYQHPMYNNEFDLIPEEGTDYRGDISRMVSRSGRDNIIPVSGLSASEALYALTGAMDSPYIDDRYVIDTFTIEKPGILIDNVEPITIGDDLFVSGRTNCAAKNTAANGDHVGDDFTLTISRLDMDTGGKTQSAIKIVTQTTPVKASYEDTSYPHTFAFEEIDTHSWYAGQYEVRVESKDLRYSQTFLLDVGGEGFGRDETTVSPKVDSHLNTVEPTKSVTPSVSNTGPDVHVVPTENHATPVPTQKTPMGLFVILLSLLCIFVIIKE